MSCCKQALCDLLPLQLAENLYFSKVFKFMEMRDYL